MTPEQAEPTAVLSVDEIENLARMLVGEAKRSGVIVTITERSLVPLAMGHLEMVVSARPARVAAAPE